MLLKLATILLMSRIVSSSGDEDLPDGSHGVAITITKQKQDPPAPEVSSKPSETPSDPTEAPSTPEPGTEQPETTTPSPETSNSSDEPHGPEDKQEASPPTRKRLDDQARTASETMRQESMMMENMLRVAQTMSALGITGVSLGTHVHVLCTYVDLLHRIMAHLASIANMEHEAYTSIQQVQKSISDLTYVDYLANGIEGAGEVSEAPKPRSLIQSNETTKVVVNMPTPPPPPPRRRRKTRVIHHGYAVPILYR